MTSTLAESTCLKLRGDAKDLANAVGISAAVAPAKSARPILQNVLLEAHDGVLDVTGTDMEVTARTRVERVEIVNDGRILVNASRLLQILRELAGDQVEIAVSEQAGCCISTAEGKWQVLGEQADDFPAMTSWPGKGVFELKSADLIDMIQRTYFAAHPEKTRYAMNGTLFDLRDKRLHLVATDGKRLALCDRPLKKEIQKPVHVVIPTKGMMLLQRMLVPSGDPVEIAVDSTQIHLRTATSQLSARLIQGHFPPYEDVLPQGHDKALKVAREAFMCALRRASLLGTKDSQAVRFRFDREGISLTARVPEVGESRVQFPLDFPYDELEIGFNPGFFLDVLKIVDLTEFTLELKDGKSAAMIRESCEGYSYLYLIMPLDLGA